LPDDEINRAVTDASRLGLGKTVAQQMIDGVKRQAARVVRVGRLISRPYPGLNPNDPKNAEFLRRVQQARDAPAIGSRRIMAHVREVLGPLDGAQQRLMIEKFLLDEAKTEIPKHVAEWQTKEIARQEAERRAKLIAGRQETPEVREAREKKELEEEIARIEAMNVSPRIKDALLKELEKPPGKRKPPPIPTPVPPIVELPFGITSENLGPNSERIEALLKEHPEVAAAVERDNALLKEWNDRRAAAWKSMYGTKPPEEMNTSYIHHETLRYLEMEEEERLAKGGGTGGGGRSVSTRFQARVYRAEHQPRQRGLIVPPPVPGEKTIAKAAVTEPFLTSYVSMRGRVMANLIADTLRLEAADWIQKNGDASVGLRAQAMALQAPEVGVTLRALAQPDGLAELAKGNLSLDELGRAAGKTISLGRIEGLHSLLPDTPTEEWADVIRKLAEYHAEQANLPAGEYAPLPDPEMLKRIQAYAKLVSSKMSPRLEGKVRVADVLAVEKSHKPVIIEGNGWLGRAYNPRRSPSWIDVPLAGQPETPNTPENQAILKAVLEGELPPGTRDLKVVSRRRASPFLYLPNEWADTLANANDPGIDPDLHEITGWAQQLMRALKIAKYAVPWQIGTLGRLKFITDFAGALQTNPGALLELPKALGSARQFLKQGTFGEGQAGEDLKHFLFEGGNAVLVYSLSEGLRERGGVSADAILARVDQALQEEIKHGRLMIKGKDGVYRVASLPDRVLRHAIDLGGSVGRFLGKAAVEWGRIVPEYIDLAFRIAHFRSYMKQMRQDPSGQGIPKNFGASNFERVMGLPDIRDRAVLMANNNVGNMTDASKALRAWNRWFPGGGIITQQALNRRTMMSVRNFVTLGRQYELIGQRVADANPEVVPSFWKRSPGLMKLIAQFVLGVGILPAIVVAYNNLFQRERRSKLPPWQRGELSLTLPDPLAPNDPNAAVNIPITLVPGIAEWLYADHSGYWVQQVHTGRMSASEAFKQMIGQFSDQAWIRMGPGRLAMELHQGVSPFTNRPISPAQSVSRYYGATWALDLYERQFGHQPVKSDWKNDLFAHTVGADRYDLANAQYVEMRRAARIWSAQQHGSDLPAAQYAAVESPAFWYRESLRRNDPIEAQYWLGRMAMMQGELADDRLELAARRLEPLFAFPRGDQQRFLKTLDPTDQDRMRASYRYWANWVAPQTHTEGLDQIHDLNQWINQMRRRVEHSLERESPARQWLRERPTIRALVHQRERAERQRARNVNAPPVPALPAGVP